MGRIAYADLVEMFQDIRETTNWDMSADMLWGYFFTDKDPGKLARTETVLRERGYRCVHIREPEDDPRGLHWLHVERVETHSVDSLHARNQELEALAKEFELNSYDGMDVGPVPSDAG